MRLNILRFLACFIVAVAVYDIYCTVKLHDSILHCEENPVALWCIKMRENTLHTTHPSDPNKTVQIRFSSPDVSLLIAVKSAGLCCYISGIQWVITYAAKIASMVIIPIFCGAVWLLVRLVH